MGLTAPAPLYTLGGAWQSTICGGGPRQLNFPLATAFGIRYVEARRNAPRTTVLIVTEVKAMARCEQGYLCDVCGKDVEAITDSDLYLRYVLGEVPPERLPKERERHIRCNPSLAQFIVDAAFEPVSCAGMFDKGLLDPNFVAEQENRVSRAWRRLQEIPKLGIDLTEYPLIEVRQAWSG